MHRTNLWRKYRKTHWKVTTQEELTPGADIHVVWGSARGRFRVGRHAGGEGGAAPFLCIFEKEHDQPSLKRIFSFSLRKGMAWRKYLIWWIIWAFILVRVIVFCINLQIMQLCSLISFFHHICINKHNNSKTTKGCWKVFEVGGIQVSLWYWKRGETDSWGNERSYK